MVRKVISPVPGAYGSSVLEREFKTYLRTVDSDLLDGMVREYRFDPGRKWRLDFAWPHARVAVEVDGLLRSGRGGHQTVDGIEADCEKAAAAQRAGWTILRVPGSWLIDGNRRVWNPVIALTLRVLLDR